MKKRTLSVILAAATIIGTMSAGTAAVYADDAKDDYTVGMTLNLGNLTWAELAESAKAHGKELGMNVTVQNSNDDATTQVSQIENFIQADVDAIIVAAVESNSVEDVCKAAQDAGIKVIAYTQVIENADAEYLVDAYNTGYACGKRAAEWIKEVYGDEPIEWALEDLPKYPEIIDRANGIKEAIEELAPNAELVATQPAEVMEDGQKNAENFMQSHPDIKVICSIGSGGGAGANEGVKSYISEDEYDKFGIFGIDATEQEIMNIINGDPQKSSVSLGGGAKHGEMLIDIADNFRNGVEQEKEQYMPITVIDSSNAQEYYDEQYGDK
ncbi:sugar ABC transporter substrate-binding protein [Blautia sp.]|uniref:sugar ABC transporter substrate-binding protein n=1 Tax=Blautia sp. TaxID=1955243 RepID=UPI003AF7B27D